MSHTFPVFLRQQITTLLSRLLMCVSLPTTQLMIFIFGLVVMAVGVVELFHSSQTDTVECPENRQVEPYQCAVAPSGESTSASASSQLVVDIAGAVNNPGVYQLNSSAVVSDAVALAGGLAKSANKLLIARQLNLAQRLQPFQKLYIPFIDDISLPVANESQLPKSADELASVKININTASQKELELLAGVGESTAAKLIANRPYGTVDELVEKKVFSSSLLEKLSAEISL